MSNPSIPFLKKEKPDIKKIVRRLKYLADARPPYGDCENVSRYEQVCCLSQPGDNSVVYKVEERATGEEYAFKRLKTSEKGSRGIPQRFYNETQLLPKLKHQNILALEGFAFGYDLGCMYMKFEFCRENMRQLLQSISPLEPCEIKRMMIMLLDALHYMHEQHIMHRDIAPENILIHPSGMLKIGGFGKVISFPSRRKKLESEVGTTGYRAPELVGRADFYTSAVDIWSLGCIFAELILHRSLFTLSGTDQMQMNDIIKLLGSPSHRNEPCVFSYPLMSGKYKFVQQESSLINETFRNILPSAVSLMKCIFKYDPIKRRNAEGCVRHAYFSSEPTACDAADLLTRFERKRNESLMPSVKVESSMSALKVESSESLMTTVKVESMTTAVNVESIESSMSELKVDSSESLMTTVNVESSEYSMTTVNVESSESLMTTVNVESNESPMTTVNVESSESPMTTVNVESSESPMTTVNVKSSESPMTTEC